MIWVTFEGNFDLFELINEGWKVKVARYKSKSCENSSNVKNSFETLSVWSRQLLFRIKYILPHSSDILKFQNFAYSLFNEGTTYCHSTRRKVRRRARSELLILRDLNDDFVLETQDRSTLASTCWEFSQKTGVCSIITELNLMWEIKAALITYNVNWISMKIDYTNFSLRILKFLH